MAAVAVAATGSAAPTDLKLARVDFLNGLVIIENVGQTYQSLAGWRLCSHDADEKNRFTNASAFGRERLGPGERMAIHFNNDASPTDPFAVNASSLGDFATPLAPDAYAIQLFQAPGLNDPEPRMIDHLQWSIDGADDENADELSGEAEDAFLWTNQSKWIVTTKRTDSIVLIDEQKFLLPHVPEDYYVNNGVPCNKADLNEPIGELDLADVVAFVQAFGTGSPAADFVAPFGELDIADVVEFLRLMDAGCS
ncbi:MAG: hypothetical protein CMJ31_14575 [Phycisphaerae bacterium]|nr:hypothetical protein [Phycisphaerae bacterium]